MRYREEVGSSFKSTEKVFPGLLPFPQMLFCWWKFIIIQKHEIKRRLKDHRGKVKAVRRF